MAIPIFKEKTIPIYEMESYINEEPSEEAKQFERILSSIRDFDLIPKVEEMTAILEYEQQALDYCFRLAVNTLNKRGFEKSLFEITQAVNGENVYSECLKNDISFAKYCTLQKVLGELFIIHKIKNAVREVIFDMGDIERATLEAIKDLKTESK